MTPPALNLGHTRRGRVIATLLAIALVLVIGYLTTSLRDSDAGDGAQSVPDAAAVPNAARPNAARAPEEIAAIPAAVPAGRPTQARPVDQRQRVTYSIPAPRPSTTSRTTTTTHRSTPTVSPHRSPAPKHSSPPAKKSNSSGYSQSSYAYAVLAKLNSERAAHGLRALHMNSQLVASAHAHNLAMARANTMSHQLPGEPYFASRITAAGYRYQDAGENIGWNSDVSQSGALVLESDMYAEGPPPSGTVNHYANIVSKQYTDVGIEVWIDTVHHKLWLTEDFGDR